jgi:hypothetical protein
MKNTWNDSMQLLSASRHLQAPKKYNAEGHLTHSHASKAVSILRHVGPLGPLLL